jgi:integrase
MWSDEDNAIFIKYCSGPKNKASHIRNQAYHMVARDTMGRPCDLLGLKVGDFDFDKNMKYVDIMIGYGGKTGPRRVTLTDSVPYVMRWLELHHQKHNKDAYLFYSEKTGIKLDSQSIHNIYKAYKRHFIRLSRSKGIPEEDRVKIQKLLQKPFAPYLFKHRKMIKGTKTFCTLSI